jgi:conjugal transfer pilus assembly protein TraK
LSVVLTLTAAQRDREVVLQPVLAKPLTLSSSHIDKDYLELVTRDAALLTLNRSPSNLQYWMDSILAITDPRTHGRMKAELMKIFNEQNGSNVSQFFTIENLTVDPDALTSEVNGVLHTVVGSKEVTSEARTFRYVWSYSGVSLKLAGFGRVTKDPSGKVIDAKGSQQQHRWGRRVMAVAGLGRDRRRNSAGRTAPTRLPVGRWARADLLWRALPRGEPRDGRPEHPAADNGTVACVASAKDLTRISLAGDQFASVSKISTGNPAEDFKIVNEPVRGDIYISVPDGFTKPNLSFFGTTRKGFVYKFLCQVRGNDAEQVFVTNTAIKAEAARDWEVRSSPEDTAVRLAQAMYRSETIEGFEIRQSVLEPVAVGKLEVQQVGEYRGADLKGLILRVRNTGREALPLDENLLAGRTSVAFMTPVSKLAPGQAAAVYLIQSNGAQ